LMPQIWGIHDYRSFRVKLFLYALIISKGYLIVSRID
jgi:hypothetical protein